MVANLTDLLTVCEEALVDTDAVRVKMDLEGVVDVRGISAEWEHLR